MLKGINVTTLSAATESATRWQAWRERGRVQDLRLHRNAKLVAAGLATAAAVALAAAFLLR
jgi:hypothetical protein